MSKDRIEGKDVYGDAWCLSSGSALMMVTKDMGAVAFVDVDDDADSAALSQQDAMRWALFLLRAVGVDLIKAARKVVMAEADSRTAAQHGSMAYMEAIAIKRKAIDALSTELAKLEGVADG